MAKDELKPQQRGEGKDVMGKSDNALQAELKEMRKQLDALRASGTASEGRNRSAPAGKEAESVASSSGGGSQQAEKDKDKGEAADLSAQLQELVDGMGRELKDTNPITLLAVFAIGIFVGRLLPR